jgi:hypothetical protein
MSEQWAGKMPVLCRISRVSKLATARGIESKLDVGGRGKEGVIGPPV